MVLDGRELAAQIKQRQTKTIAGLAVKPRLGIIAVNPDAPSRKYMELKQEYALDIGAAVDLYERADGKAAETKITELNKNKAVHGIIVQLPLPDGVVDIAEFIEPGKDVDTLNAASPYVPPTPQAILWLLEKYDVDLKAKKVVLVGRGRLVGGPLSRLLTSQGVEHRVLEVGDNLESLKNADVIVTATGSHGLIKCHMLKPGVVLVDAGTSEQAGKLVGDVDPEVQDRTDISATPPVGGVGPLTVCALFENLIKSAQNKY
jgi:methylenetetrahydrofolate dehydrogenase (NADP+) / methenyltetrahydrofolate cyclohydrolase